MCMSPRTRFPPPDTLYRTASRSGAGSSKLGSGTRVSSASIAARQRARSDWTASLTNVLHLERSVRPFDQALEARLDLAEVLSRPAQSRDTFLEQLQRALELELVAFQLRDDLLEA